MISEELYKALQPVSVMPAVVLIKEWFEKSCPHVTKDGFASTQRLRHTCEQCWNDFWEELQYWKFIT